MQTTILFPDATVSSAGLIGAVLSSLEQAVTPHKNHLLHREPASVRTHSRGRQDYEIRYAQCVLRFCSVSFSK